MDVLSKPAWPIPKQKARLIVRAVAIAFICIEVFVLAVLGGKGKL
jgi:hypothetical protein